MLLGRLIDIEHFRPRLQLASVRRILEDREPVRDRPIDLGIPELLFTLRCHPPEEIAYSFPGQAKRGEQGGDASADRSPGAPGAPDYETDANEGGNDRDDQQGRESGRDLPGGLPQLARHTVGSRYVVGETQAILARDVSGQHFVPAPSLLKQVLGALFAAGLQRRRPQAERVVGGMRSVGWKLRRKGDEKPMHVSVRLSD